MNLLEQFHGVYAARRRVSVLATHLARLLPRDVTVLDVGCGDGILAKTMMDQRPDVTIQGIDVLVRDRTPIPVQLFDGSRIPAADRAHDVVMFVDVLHHTTDPLVLLHEARRVARRHILIKDHTCNGTWARSLLRFMDNVGNARHGVALPYNYWPGPQWHAAFLELDLRVDAFVTGLALYPVWADWLFGRSLHFVTRLSPS